MIESLIKNKEWIFSGIGASMALALCSWLLNRSSTSSPAIQVEIVSPEQFSERNHTPNSEVSSIVKRFAKTLELMNENRTDKYTIAGLAQLMKLHSVGELESLFNGTREPSFEFIDHFCKTFGVNKNWLIEGKDTPFSNHEESHFYPLDYLKTIQQQAPNKIYFIRSASKTGEVFLLLKFSDWSYKVISRVWHISDQVGAGGERQIFGMYRLIEALLNELGSYRCGGRILTPDLFSNLLEGRVFPGSVIDFPARENPWWEDFIDVNHSYAIAPSYESWYGKGFIAAQGIVRRKLTEQAKNAID